MVLMNYIALFPGVPTRMHFTDWYFIVSEIMDKESGKTKPVKRVVFWVDELNGEDVARTLSMLSKKLIAPLIPFIKDKEFINYDFIITPIGDGYYKDWNVQPIRRAEEVPLSERQGLADSAKLLEKLWESI